jgi:hypothetical protein
MNKSRLAGFFLGTLLFCVFGLAGGTPLSAQEYTDQEVDDALLADPCLLQELHAQATPEKQGVIAWAWDVVEVYPTPFPASSTLEEEVISLEACNIAVEGDQTEGRDMLGCFDRCTWFFSRWKAACGRHFSPTNCEFIGNLLGGECMFSCIL